MGAKESRNRNMGGLNNYQYYLGVQNIVIIVQWPRNPILILKATIC